MKRVVVLGSLLIAAVGLHWDQLRGIASRIRRTAAVKDAGFEGTAPRFTEIEAAIRRWVGHARIGAVTEPLNLGALPAPAEWDQVIAYPPGVVPPPGKATVLPPAIAYHLIEHRSLLVFELEGTVQGYAQLNAFDGDFSTAAQPHGYAREDAVFALDLRATRPNVVAWPHVVALAGHDR